jgi:lipid-A-disaccharide synthase-like uncharacterized protein
MNTDDNKYEYLMNVASSLFFICYIPEFYANYKNKNANLYNVFEKIVMIGGSAFALSYALQTENNALIVNYAPIFTLDAIALFIRAYYAYINRHIDVSINNTDIYNHNPLQQQAVLQQTDIEL